MCFVKLFLGIRWRCCCIRSGTQVDASTAFDDANEPNTQEKPKTLFGRWFGSLSGGSYVVKSGIDENAPVTGVGIGGKVGGHVSGSTDGDVAVFDNSKIAPKVRIVTIVDDSVMACGGGFVGEVGCDEVEGIVIPKSDD